MWAAEKLMTTTDIEIHQFKIKNLVICENYKYRNIHGLKMARQLPINEKKA
jgi:hypothetical protein